MADAVLVEAYDLVYAFGVIHHTPHPHRVLEQIRRYLHPDGAVKIRVYHRRSWKVLQILCRRGFRFWALDQLSARYSEAQTGCPVTYTYTARQARRLLEDRIADYVAYRYRRVRYFRWLPAPVFRRLEGWLSWQPCLTAGLGS
jgi:SAM-dependent methyltransferase